MVAINRSFFKKGKRMEQTKPTTPPDPVSYVPAPGIEPKQVPPGKIPCATCLQRGIVQVRVDQAGQGFCRCQSCGGRCYLEHPPAPPPVVSEKN